jgi:4-amino-4-deoxychorismate lyase
MGAFRAAGARVEVRDVDPAELERASELFLTNALIGAWPVAELEGRRLAPGPWVRRAQAWLGSW